MSSLVDFYNVDEFFVKTENKLLDNIISSHHKYVF